ncbi:MAG: YicC family protein [Acidobacteriota bacterium]|nr:YicC family protein [Acidobacteriota bacterium]
MPVRSMTAFAQVKGQAGDQLGFTLSLKSVNHRFLDLNLRMPSETDALEMKMRKALKERLARGHVDVTLAIERGTGAQFEVNKTLVGGYVEAFRAAARVFGVVGEPDLNAILRMPGALNSALASMDGAFEAAVTAKLDECMALLDEMRTHEGAGIERELRERMKALKSATSEIEKLRGAVSRSYLEKVEARMKELIGAHAEKDRILQEAALLAERSDIQEEIVRMHNHIAHFLQLLEQGTEVGKKLDFLLQEMNRESNTLLSKTSGVSGEGLRITELGLAMKSEIEKAREQVQNVE